MVSPEQSQIQQELYLTTLNAIYQAFVPDPEVGTSESIFFQRTSKLTIEELSCLSNVCQGYFDRKLNILKTMNLNDINLKSAIAKITCLPDLEGDTGFHAVLWGFDKLKLIMLHQQILGQLQFKLNSEIVAQYR